MRHKKNRRTFRRRPGHGPGGFAGAAALLAVLALAGQGRQFPEARELFQTVVGADSAARPVPAETAEAVAGQAPGDGTQAEETEARPELRPVGADPGESREETVTVGEDAGAVWRPSAVTLADIPAYAGQDYVEVNGNEPVFSEAERSAGAFEFYSELDALGRCGYAEAKITPELMPTEERGAIGQIRPSGWHTVKYEGIDGNYLYNRCHLIAYQLTGENANEKNLITGTRYMNTVSMLPWENRVADALRTSGGAVLYRVTPLYDGDNLVASGVEMEAESVGSDAIRFHIFVYNVQPGIVIDYSNGDSRAE